MNRSYLFAPGHNAKLLDRVFTAGADAVMLDLEDAVPPAQKAAARRMVAAALADPPAADAPAPPAWVRVNAARTDLCAADLDAVAADAHGIRIPKAESPEDVAWVAERAPGKPIICAIESARGAVRHPRDVLGRLGLRDPDAVRVGGDGVQVGRAEVGAGGVDPHPGPDRPARRGGGRVGQLRRHHPARQVLGRGRHRVLEVEHQRVGACGEHPVEQLGVVPGREEVAALHHTTPFARNSASRSPSTPSDP